MSNTKQSPTTKEDIINVHKAWNSCATVAEVAEKTGMNAQRVTRIVALVRKLKPSLFPKKSKKAYLQDLIKSAIAEL